LEFTVLVSLIPFLITALIKAGQSGPFVLASLWPHGELLLVSTALAADGIGDLFAFRGPYDGFKLTVGFGFFVVVVVTVAWYAILQVQQGYSVNFISKGSIALFGSVVVTGASVKLFIRE
jgi:hypothetical protein